MNSGGAGSLEVCNSKIILNFNFRISEYFGVLYCLFAYVSYYRQYNTIDSIHCEQNVHFNSLRIILDNTIQLGCEVSLAGGHKQLIFRGL